MHNLPLVVDDTHQRVYDDCGVAVTFAINCGSDLGLCSSTCVELGSGPKFSVHRLATWTSYMKLQLRRGVGELLTGAEGLTEGTLRGLRQ